MTSDLSRLRERIDELDREFVRVVAARLAVCEEVAELKRSTGAAVIQPARVREVITSRRQLAIDAGVDPDFAEQLFRVLLAETHRIEVVTHRPGAAPDKVADQGDTRSGIDTVATRIDHVVVAVDDLEAAVDSFTGEFGFHRLQPKPDFQASGIRPDEGGAGERWAGGIGTRCSHDHDGTAAQRGDALGRVKARHLDRRRQRRSGGER